MGFICEICRTKLPGVATHHFPNPFKYPERFKEWVYNAGGKLNSPSDIEFFHKKKRLCDIHFKVEYKNRNKRLSALAVPTLHLPGPPPGKENTKLQETASDQSDPDIQKNYILIVDKPDSPHIQEKCQPIKQTQIIKATELSDSSPDIQEKCQPVTHTQLVETRRLYIRDQRSERSEHANDGFLELETDPLAEDVEDFQDVSPAPKISKVDKVKVANLVKITEDQDVSPAPKISKLDKVKVANLVKITEDQDVSPAPKISKVNEVKVANLVKITVADDDVKDKDVSPTPKIFKVNKVDNLVKLPVADDVNVQQFASAPKILKVNKVDNLVKLPFDDDVNVQKFASAPKIFKLNKVVNLVKLPVANDVNIQKFASSPKILKVNKVGNLVKRPVADDVNVQKFASAPKIFKLKKVNADKLVELPERLYAKPTPRTEEENAELYLLDILDPDLLTDSIEPANQHSVGENLRSTLSRAWPPVLAFGLASEAKQKIIGRYPRPKNCRSLQTPKMYSKMAEIVPEKVIANDDKLFKMQLCVGTAITAVSRAMEMLIMCKSREKALRHLTNGCLMLCDLHYTHTKIRTTSVIPFVDDTTKAVINDYENHGDTLFGPDFVRNWKAAKKVEKAVRKRVPKRGRKKKKVTCRSGPSLVAYSGRWRAPVKVKVRREPPHTPRRRFRQRAATNPVVGVMRNRTKRLKQTEQYDAFGNIIAMTPPDIEASHSHMQTVAEDGCVQEEVTDDVLKQTCVTYNRNNSVERTNCGDGTKYYVQNRTNEMEHCYALSNKITPTPPDIETSTSHMLLTQEDGYNIQQQLVVDQLNQPINTDNPQHPVKRKNPMICDDNKPSRKGSTKKLKQTEQFDAFGNRIRKLYRLDTVTSIPASHPHMRIQRGGASVQQPNPLLLAHLSQTTINSNPNKTLIITRGATPLVLPPKMRSRDMPTLHSNDMPTLHSNDMPTLHSNNMPTLHSNNMPVLHSNDEPPDLMENTQTEQLKYTMEW